MKTDILNNIETDKTWIDVETVAKLKDISKRGVRLSLNSGKYEFKVEKSRGGKTYKKKRTSILERILSLQHLNSHNSKKNRNRKVKFKLMIYLSFYQKQNLINNLKQCFPHY